MNSSDLIMKQFFDNELRRQKEFKMAWDKDAVAIGQLATSIEVRNRDIVPNLKAQRQELMNRINKIDALLQLLERNPDFQKLFDLTRELI